MSEETSTPSTSGRGKPPPVVSLGSLWFVGWLFTIGYAHLSFWRGALAFLLWPYYLGSTMH
jgi:hypothetical protein